MSSSLNSKKKKFLEEDIYISKIKDDHKSTNKKKKCKKMKSKKELKLKRKISVSSTESSSSENDEVWVEKSVQSKHSKSEAVDVKNEWMDFGSKIKTFTRKDINICNSVEKSTKIETYIPTKNVKELNPYWKTNGTGLPDINNKINDIFAKSSSSNKCNFEESDSNNDIFHNINFEEKLNSSHFLNDEEINKLGAKIIKAEICGNTELVAELTLKLKKAKEFKKNNKDFQLKKPEEVVLTITNSQGKTLPLKKNIDIENKKNRKMETYTASGERVRFFADDDKYSLKQMFEKEKFGFEDLNKDFVKSISKCNRSDNDVDEIFSEKITKSMSNSQIYTYNKNKSISQHKIVQQSLDNCEYCIDSQKSRKMMICTGSKIYISLPQRGSLVKNHCLLSTITHASCSIMLDEDVWEEINAYRRALTNMFNSKNEDVIFFETATFLHKYPHLNIHCVPLPRNIGDSASIYFKKALLECETEWSDNIKVIDLKGKPVHKSLPKGLPYFWVDFGMNHGFAHVIEDQQKFPKYFGQEIISGILKLDCTTWRNQHNNFESQIKKVSKFLNLWKSFDPKY